MSDFGLSIAASGLIADTRRAGHGIEQPVQHQHARATRRRWSTSSPEAAAGPLEAGRGVTVASVSELTDAVYESANVAGRGRAGGGQPGQPGHDLDRDHLPRAEQRRPVGAALHLLDGPLDPGRQSATRREPSRPSQPTPTVWPRRSTTPRHSSPSCPLRCNRRSGPGPADGGTLAQANGAPEQVAQLNQGIVAGDAAGQNVNALSDERRSAVDQLAGLLGISTSTAPRRGADHPFRRRAARVRQRRRDADVTPVRPPRPTSVSPRRPASPSARRFDRRQPHRGEHDAARVPGPALRRSPTLWPETSTRCRPAAWTPTAIPVSAIAGGYTGTVLPNIFVDQGSASTYTPSTISAATIAVSSAYLAVPSLIATAAAPGPGNSQRHRHRRHSTARTRRRWRRWPARRTGPDALYQSLIGTLGTEASNASAPRPPHRTWPRRRPPTWPRSPA